MKVEKIYGIHAVEEALEAGVELEKIYIKKGITPEVKQRIREKAGKRDVPVQTVPEVKIEKLARNIHHQGVVALGAVIKYVPLGDLIHQAFEQKEKPLFVLLDRITDVRNLGAIARSAECLGAHGLIISTHGGAQVNGEAVRISAGALNHLPVARVEHPVDGAMIVQSYGIRIVTLFEKGVFLPEEAELTEPTCLVMGAEGQGVTKRLKDQADYSVRIPMTGNINSLNVSVAAGIVLAEAARQRREK